MRNYGSLKSHLKTPIPQNWWKYNILSKIESFILLPLDGAASCRICAMSFDLSFVQIPSQYEYMLQLMNDAYLSFQEDAM